MRHRSRCCFRLASGLKSETLYDQAASKDARWLHFLLDGTVAAILASQIMGELSCEVTADA